MQSRSSRPGCAGSARFAPDPAQRSEGIGPGPGGPAHPHQLERPETRLPNMPSVENAQHANPGEHHESNSHTACAHHGSKSHSAVLECPREHDRRSCEFALHPAGFSRDARMSPPTRVGGMNHAYSESGKRKFDAIERNRHSNSPGPVGTAVSNRDVRFRRTSHGCDHWAGNSQRTLCRIRNRGRSSGPESRRRRLLLLASNAHPSGCRDSIPPSHRRTPRSDGNGLTPRRSRVEIP
jgi:hypothetical protein